jgi:TP901 family phage tail tape measure protein
MEQAGVQLIAQGIAAYLDDMKSATRATNTFVDSTEHGGGRVGAAGQVMIGALRQVGVIAVQAFGVALRAGADFIGDSVKLAGDFDQTMSVLQATSEATAEEMAAVSAKAKALGADLTLPATSAVDAGKAMLELSKAGFTVAESMDAAKGVLQLAAAAQISEARAAEINANAINAFNLEAKDSIFVSDLLAASANASSIEATDMADTYKMAAAVFSNFQGPVVGSKQSIIDLTTAAGLLGNAGIKGSDAGTALKQSLLQLTAPSDKAKALMKALAEDIGVAGDIAYDAQGTMRSFPEILGLVSESTKSLSDEQRNYIISTIFGADATRAILVLMNEGPDAWAKMETAVTRQGAAADLAAAQTEGYKGALEGAKSQVETLQLTIGQALTPVLAELLNKYVSPGISTLTSLAEALLGNDDAFNTLSPTMQGVAKGIKQFFDDVENGIHVVQGVIAQIDELMNTFAAAEAETNTLGSAVDDLSGVWTKAQGVVENVLSGYEAIATAVLPIVTGFINEHGTEIEAFFKTTWDSVIEIVNLALDLYNSIVPPILKAIAGFIDAHGSEIQKILSGAWDVIESLITGTLDTIKGVFKTALALINGDWEGAWNGIKGIVDTQAKAIDGVITGFLNIIAGLFDTTLDDILQTWEDNWNMLYDIATSIDWGEVGEAVVSGVISGLSGAWGSLVDWLSDKMGGLVDAAMSAIGASSPAKEFMPVGQYAVQGIMQGFEDMWPALTELVSTMSDDLIEIASDIGRNIQNAIADSFGATANIDRQMASNLEKLQKIPEGFYKKATTLQLKAAEDQARAFADPATGAKFFAMRSKQILEFQELQQKINKEEDAETKKRLQQQQILILAAQEAEQSAFQAQFGAQTNPMEDIAKQIASLFNNAEVQKLQKEYAEADSDKERARIMELIKQAAVAVNDTGIGHDINALLTQLEIFTGMYAPPGTASPPASAQQMAAPSGGATYDYSRHTPMTVYTNNTPAALQQSLAIANASMP